MTLQGEGPRVEDFMRPEYSSHEERIRKDYGRDVPEKSFNISGCAAAYAKTSAIIPVYPWPRALQASRQAGSMRDCDCCSYLASLSQGTSFCCELCLRSRRRRWALRVSRRNKAGSIAHCLKLFLNWLLTNFYGSFFCAQPENPLENSTIAAQVRKQSTKRTKVF